MLRSKLPNLGTTIFSVMSQLAQEHQASNLSQGFPDFDCHPELLELVYQYMQKGRNQYAPMPGLPALREIIAHKIKQTYQYDCNYQEEITVVSGASEAIFNALAASVRPGDEVIIFEPAYDLYRPVIELFGGKVVALPLNPEDYSLPQAEILANLNERTRLVFINTPHNPTGTTLKAKDLEFLANTLPNYPELLLLSDEVYEHIIFDEAPHQSALRYPVLRERSFVVFSFGKTFHATGWKIGYCVAPPVLSREFRKIHQYNTFSTFTPAQFALADFLQDEAHYNNLGKFYQERRDKFRTLLSETPFKLLPCEGTYFQLASYAHLSEEKDHDYCVRLTKEVGVATIPVSAFYGDSTDNKVIRFCFAKKYETMAEAVEKIQQNRHCLTH